MASDLTVQTIRGPGSGANANKILIPSGQTLQAPGHILQAVQVVRSDPVSHQSSTFADLMTLNITPSSATNKIMLICQIQHSGYNTTDGFRFMRGTTPIAIGDSNSNRTRISFGTHESSSGALTYVQYHQKTSGLTYIDSPNTASQITYSVQMANLNGTANYMNVNRGYTYADATWDVTTVSSLIAMEVAQ